MDPGELARAALAVALLAFLPGWIWSRALLPELGILTRGVVSVALSVALMVLALYVGSAVFQIPVSAAHAVWWAMAISLAGWVVAGLRRRSALRQA